MFTKINIFAAALVSTLALSAFSAETAQAGRYRVEGQAMRAPRRRKLAGIA